METREREEGRRGGLYGGDPDTTERDVLRGAYRDGGAVWAGEGVGDEAIPEGVPVRSMAEEDEEPAERVCWCLSICLCVGQAGQRENGCSGCERR